MQMNRCIRPFCTFAASIAILSAVVSSCVHNNETDAVYAERYSRVCFNGGGVVFSSPDGAICRFDTEDNSTSVIIDDRKLVSACDAIVCLNEGATEIYDNDGAKMAGENLPMLYYGEVHDGVLYYIGEKDEKLHRYVIENGEDTEVFGISTGAFCVSDGVLYCESEESVTKCDLDGEKSEPVFEGRYPIWFCVDSGTLYVSDYDDNSKVKAVFEDGTVADTGVSSVSFCVKDDTMYYIPYVSEIDLLDRPEREQTSTEILSVNIDFSDEE